MPIPFNRKNFNVDSPFYGECIIVDEVHNFVRQILNPSSKPSKIFYDWIINAENVKLVFLSGTPVINKPSEIALRNVHKVPNAQRIMQCTV